MDLLASVDSPPSFRPTPPSTFCFTTRGSAWEGAGEDVVDDPAEGGLDLHRSHRIGAAFADECCAPQSLPAKSAADTTVAVDEDLPTALDSRAFLTLSSRVGRRVLSAAFSGRLRSAIATRESTPPHNRSEALSLFGKARQCRPEPYRGCLCVSYLHDAFVSVQ